MNIKKFIPCIFLYKKHAVAAFEDKDTVISMNPVELSRFYRDNGADGLIVFDLSGDDDREHEEALDCIKAICSGVDIPVTGAGHVKRMEDIKKLLYAGCSKAALNYSNPDNVALTQEVSLRFGREKIAACVEDGKTISDQKELLETYVCELILIRETILKACVGCSSVPFIAMLPEMTLDKLLDTLNYIDLCGVTGRLVNKNAKEIMALKTLCADKGVSVDIPGMEVKWEDFKKNADGMVPVVVQDDQTEQVLMVAYMNQEAYEATLKTGRMTYYSRSRQELWLKGETSGHFQYVRSLTADCDMDTILARVSQVGAACHTGKYSCFFNEIVRKKGKEENPLKIFQSVLEVIKDRKTHPKEGSYTNYLFDKGIDKILKKLGEEATEIVIAAKNPNPNEIKYEIADFLYHMMVLMVERGVTWEEITEELAQR